MVNNGNDQHASQFLITVGENVDYLDGVHTVFGEVTEGMDVLVKINEAFVDKDFCPYQDIRITHTVILDDPFDDPPGLQIPDRSPEPTKEQLDSGRIGADEEIDDTKGKTADEIEEVLAEKEAKTKAILLEMVGDLPDAEIKPPENVLFVCKLNPVTTDEDLEVIFSRFGPIKSCEIIRDWKTGESLCYAFIEFEKQEHCENAYFKMDNVLIDDRRIHVDFSQSVAKVQWKGKGAKYTKDDFKEYEKDLSKHSNITLKSKVQPKQDPKYELLLDEAEPSGSYQHSKKPHKEKWPRRHLEEEECDRWKAANCKATTDKETKQHRNISPIDEYGREKDRDQKKRKQYHSRSRSGSQEKDHHKRYRSKKSRHRERTNRSPKKSK